MKSNIRTILFLFASCILSGCSTLSTGAKLPPLNGMIYDNDNKPVNDCSIMIDGKLRAQSDVYGRFSLSGLRKNDKHTVSVEKQGFEKIEIDLVYSDPTQILYIHMFSSSQLLAEAEKSLKNNDLGIAENFISRAESIKADSSITGYLRAVVLYQRKQYKECTALLSTLLDNNKNQPFVYLFLADVNQYQLDDSVATIQYLKQYLELKRDPDVEERLRSLQTETIPEKTK